jgi:shikimate kinase
MNLILIGFKNCGKSTVGQALAQKFYCEFVDTDIALQELYTADNNISLSIPEIFQKEGEAGFRDWENRVVTELKDINNAIVSTGGGIVLKNENVTALKKLGKIIYLSASVDELIQRQNKTRVPEFLDNNDPVASFMKMYNARKPVYEQVADYVVDVDNKHAPEIVNEIVNWVEHQG